MKIAMDRNGKNPDAGMQSPNRQEKNKMGAAVAEKSEGIRFESESIPV